MKCSTLCEGQAPATTAENNEVITSAGDVEDLTWEEDDSCSDTSSACDDDTYILVGAPASERQGQVGDAVHLSDMLLLLAMGLPSAGSKLHDSGACVVCKYEMQHTMFGSRKCVKGILCERCHCDHQKLSRRELRKRNLQNASMSRALASTCEP